MTTTPHLELRPTACAVACLTLLCLLAPTSAVAQRSSFLETFDAAWELILDTHFDRELNGVDWQEVREELRPQAAAATSNAELREVLQEMIGRLGQSHFAVLPSGDAPAGDAGPEPAAPEPAESGDRSAGQDPEGSESCPPALRSRLLEILETGGAELQAAGVGLGVRELDQRLVVARVEPDSAASRAGLASGLEVLRIDDLDLRHLVDCVDSLAGGGTASLLATLGAGLLAGPEGSTASVELADGDGEARTVELVRAHPEGSVPVRFGNLPPIPVRFQSRSVKREGRHFALLRFNIWMVPVAPRFERAMAELHRADGFVLDLRGNPGGVAALAQGIAGYFVDEPLSLGTMASRRDRLELRINPRRVLRDGTPFEPYAGPLAILVDGQTGSTSEIFAAALQDHGRARLFGEPTAGAALPAQAQRLPNGDVLLHATGDFIRPGGGRIEGRPVVPDERVAPTRKALLEGRDEVLEAALSWLSADPLPDFR